MSHPAPASLAALETLPPVVRPGVGSTVAFVLVVAAVLTAAVFAVHRSAPRGARGRWSGVAALALAMWAVVTAALSESGALAVVRTPPPILLFVGVNLLLCLGLAASPLAGRLARALPMAALVGFHSFRLPLELVLHDWVAVGTLPVQMTWTGHNFDIVTGVLGLVVGLWAWKGSPPRWVLWAFQAVGLALLVTVASIALRSAPGPLRTYLNEPPVLVALAAPLSWIVPFCVGAALVAHVVGIRALLLGRDAEST